MPQANVVVDGPQRSPSAPGTAPRRARVESIDVLRGIIMILMALDHTRDFFGNAAANPTDPATTTVPLFFTRWVTHICAPGFFLLTGVGAALTLRRLSRGELARFLFTRGLWLIFLEIVIVRDLGWQFNFDYRLTVLNVLWALGWAMIFLSALVRLPTWTVTAIGALMIATHNVLDGVQPASLGVLAPLWNVLHAPGVILDDSRHVVFLAYALIPWIGVTAVGYGLGEVYRWEAERRRRFLLQLGLVTVAAFLVLRTLNIYGDPRPWSAQKSAVFTVLSFLNANKYPPSLLFLLMTLGPILLFLRALDAGTPAPAPPRAGVRQGAALLLSAPRTLDSPAGGGRVLRALRCGALDVPVERDGAVSRHPAARLAPRPALGVPDLGRRRDRPLPAVPLVRRSQAAPRRLVAQLSLSEGRNAARRCPAPS